MYEFGFYAVATIAAILALIQAFSLCGDETDVGDKPPKKQKTAGDSDDPAHDMGDATGVSGQSAIGYQHPADKEHRAHERYYWRRQIRTNKCLNVITAIGAVAGLGGLALIYNTLKVTEIAAIAAKDQAAAALAAERPWLQVTPHIIGDFEFYKSENEVIARIPIDFSMRNIGKTPAIAAHVMAEPIIFSNQILQDQKAFCDNALKTASVDSDIGPYSFVQYTTILPKDTGYASNGILLFNNDQIQWFKKFTTGQHQPSRLNPGIIGCAIYRMGLEDAGKWHQSRFIFYVDGDVPLDPDGPKCLSEDILNRWSRL